MYHYHANRKHDAIRHAIDANGGLIRCGDATLCWDKIYGVVTEQVQGRHIATHRPVLDPRTGALVGMQHFVGKDVA